MKPDDSKKELTTQNLSKHRPGRVKEMWYQPLENGNEHGKYQHEHKHGQYQVEQSSTVLKWDKGIDD